MRLIGGLPWGAWILLAGAVVPGLVLVLRFHAAHRVGGVVGADPSAAASGAPTNALAPGVDQAPHDSPSDDTHAEPGPPSSGSEA